MDYKLREKMIIHDFEIVRIQISIMSGYIFNVEKMIEYIKDETNTMLYFDPEMNITDRGSSNATRVCIDTGYTVKGTNDSILIILDRIEGPFEGNEVESEKELENSIIKTPERWIKLYRYPIYHAQIKAEFFRRKRERQKSKISSSIEHTIEELVDEEILIEELKSIEYKRHIQKCIDNSKEPHTKVSNVSVHNFKSLKYIDDLQLKPITILSGINSCGKSSFLDSLLVLKQTVDNINYKKNLAFNGEYVRLGNYTNVVYGHKNENNIVFKVSFESQQGRGIESLIDFVYGDKDEIRENKGTIELEVVFSNLESDRNKIVAQSTVTDFKFTFKHEKGDSYVELIRVDEELYMLSYKIHKSIQNTNKKYNKTMVEVKNIEFKGFLIEPSSIYEQLQYNSHRNTFSDASVVYQFLMAINTSIVSVFDTLHYIGPLREAPSRRYIYDEVISDIGVKGENAAYLFQTEKETIKEDLFVIDDFSGHYLPFDACTLFDAVDYWMKYMGINSFNTSTNQEIIRVSLNDSNTNNINVNIADVGFGISQVFPIVLEGIRMDKGSTLILEQPEIHLHPKLQMQMADFILAMALSGRNFIIETHSDHLINRMVRRMVEDEQYQLTNLVQVYFVTPTAEGARFDPIEIDDMKGIVNWPDGFFDQAANESEMIIRAGLKKRKKHRQAIKEKKDECSDQS